ncbi:hypothetical protein AVDCRST_MAG84-1589 [uncultured Microcoleus sp.]|uniref:Uncharacterized protein n=1 Tax=uncultured Microcoleus sp. TaxID=259945 RepID=A0A6J4L8B9_9CYAN|nr:hypothetical protein AVDCRST_MAG84-1589 [uncultured Microcoleus sp.]
MNYAAFQALILQAKRVKKTWFLWYCAERSNPVDRTGYL